MQLDCNLLNTIANITNINNCIKTSVHDIHLNCHKIIALTNHTNNKPVITPFIINNNIIPHQLAYWE